MSPKRFDIQRLARTRDLSVPDWGPYGKLYAGASHLLRDRRASVDFMFAFQADGGGAVLPCFAGNDRRNFHAFGAAPELGRFAYKFDLEQAFPGKKDV